MHRQKNWHFLKGEPMPRRAKYNKQGAIIMGAAGKNAKIFSVPELAEKTGIPYRTLHNRLSVDFGRTTADELRSLFKITGMTGEEQAEVFA